MEPVCVLLQQLVTLLVHLLFDDVLAQDLIVEFQRLLINQLVVQAFSIGWLHDIALRVDAVLVALLGRTLMLALKLLFLLHCVLVVLDEALGR